MFRIHHRATSFLVAGAAILAVTVPGSQAKALTETVLHVFGGQPGDDGANPYTGLIEVSGILYGTTFNGGPNDGGTVYKFDPTTGMETVVYSFCSQTNCTDGLHPFANLLNIAGKLYGTTTQGGASCGAYPTGCGTVFMIDPDSSAETVLYSFHGGATDGWYPNGALMHMGSAVYGTTTMGGAYCGAGCGTVFKLSLKNGAESVLWSFGNGSDGQSPASGVIDVGGTLYGTAQSGGDNSGGVVYALDPATRTETVVYSFCSQTNCTDGDTPYAGLINLNGVLFGTTLTGGSGTSYNPYGQGDGTVYGIDLATGAQTFVHSFQGGKDGKLLLAPVRAVRGMLYGTTALGGKGGGDNGGGTVFKLDPANGQEKIVYSFRTTGSDGYNPNAGVINIGGTLYGTAYYYGVGNPPTVTGGYGTIFKISH
jgi:uncharacterized repeat protein (TIGR03803 family)